MIKAIVDTNVLLRLFVRDDEAKLKACVKLIREAKYSGITLYILPITILEIVWVLEKVYKYEKKEIREIIEAVLNTPELKCEMEHVFRKALISYEERNVKFADAFLGYQGLEKGIKTIFTYDEKHFKRIEGIDVRTP